MIIRRNPRPGRALLIGFGVLAAGLGLYAGHGRGWTAANAVAAQPGPSVGSAARPNIVFILSDDEDVALHAHMPKTKALLHDAGTTFENAFVTYSLCCPSRATLLRGQYPHGTGIQGNAPPLGGHATFRVLGRDSSTVATWLQGAGYRTALFGKYLNGYQPTDAVPPGWSEWYVGGNAYRSYDYTLNENGAIVAYGRDPDDFLVDVIARKAADVIRRSAAGQTPFFLYIAPFTPHGPATAAARHEGLFTDLRLPRPPAFDEADVSDKPRALRRLPRLGRVRTARLEELYRRRVRSLQSVDDLVDTVVTALRASGQLDNTYIVYMSDNGFHMGEHRLMQGKNTPYETDIRVPLVVRGPGVPAGRREAALVLNNDLAPTFAAIAGVTAPPFVDGRSLLPLFGTPARPWTRSAFLVERRGGAGSEGGQEEPGDEQVRGANSFNAIRTADHTYVEHASGERELYDLRRDPHQLRNIIRTADAVQVQALSDRLARLVRCAGSQCRAAEDLTGGPVPGR